MNTKYKLVLTFALSLLTRQAFSAVDLGPYQSTIREVMSLEAGGKFADAALLASRTSNEIAEAVRVDETVAEIENVISRENSEVITETHKLSGSGKAFFGLLGFSYNNSWDVAKIVNDNPSEVLRSQREEGQSFLKLKKDLMKYVKDNELAIFYAKIFAAKAAQLLEKTKSSETKWLLPFVTKTIGRVSAINFLGSQYVVTCVTTNYEERERSRAVEVSGILSLSYSQVHTREAFSETECDSKTNHTSVRERDFLLGKLFFADQILRLELKILSFQLMQTEEAPNYPTWGLGYFEASGVEKAKPLTVVPTGTRRHY